MPLSDNEFTSPRSATNDTFYFIVYLVCFFFFILEACMKCILFIYGVHVYRLYFQTCFQRVFLIFILHVVGLYDILLRGMY